MWLYVAALVGLWYLLRWYREKQVVSHLRDKYVFITGCDSGFGHLLARQLDLRGLRVLAACLTGKKVRQLRDQTSDRLETVILDVTKTESISAATQWVKERVGDRGKAQIPVCISLFLLSVQGRPLFRETGKIPKMFDFHSLKLWSFLSIGLECLDLSSGLDEPSPSLGPIVWRRS